MVINWVNMRMEWLWTEWGWEWKGYKLSKDENGMVINGVRMRMEWL